MPATSRWHSFTDVRILHIAPTTGGSYRIRNPKKKGHLFFGKTVSMKDQLLERSRRLSHEPTCILAYADLEFWRASIDDEPELRARETELPQHFQPFRNRLGECGATDKPKFQPRPAIHGL